MIKAVTETKYGKTLILGLSDENVRRLQKGLPILVSLRELGFGDGAVVVMAGATEDAITRELAKHFKLPS